MALPSKYTAAVRGGEGRGRSINLGINVGENLPVQNQIRSPLIFGLNSNKTEKGKGRDLRDTRWNGKGLIVVVAENGKRRVFWDNYKEGKTSFKWVPRAVTEKLSFGLGPKQPVTHSVSNLGPLSTSPCSLEAGECSNTFLGPLSSKLSPDETEESSRILTTELATPEVLLRDDEDERSLSVSPLHVVLPVGATQTKAEGVTPINQHWVSPVEVSGRTEIPLKMGFKLSSDRNSVLGHNKLSGGSILEGKRLVTLEFVPRWIGPSFPDQFLEFLRAGLMGFGVSGQEFNTFSTKELLSLPREVILVEDAVDFSVGFGETEVSNCLPLQIIDPGVSTKLVELEEGIEVLSIENKLDISSWVKHRIPGFSKLVGLSTNRHEKLCIALLQRLETEMEAANVLHRREMGSKKLAKSKNKGRRELQNLICSVNYERR